MMCHWSTSHPLFFAKWRQLLNILAALKLLHDARDWCLGQTLLDTTWIHWAISFNRKMHSSSFRITIQGRKLHLTVKTSFLDQIISSQTRLIRQILSQITTTDVLKVGWQTSYLLQKITEQVELIWYLFEEPVLVRRPFLTIGSCPKTLIKIWASFW